MIPLPMVEAETELRRIIERRKAGDVSTSLAAYGEIARKQLESLPLGDPARREIHEHIRSLLNWAKLMLYTRRSTLAEDLRILQRLHRFLGAGSGAGPRFHFDL
jgi:hypothetical protein